MKIPDFATPAMINVPYAKRCQFDDCVQQAELLFDKPSKTYKQQKYCLYHKKISKKLTTDSKGTSLSGGQERYHRYKK